MFSWLRRRFIREHRVESPDEWLVVPFRVAEAARLTIHIIANHPELSDRMKEWIAEWLDQYNDQLIYYMKSHYGAEVFPVLDQITREVIHPDVDQGIDFQVEQKMSDVEYWEKWERQMRGES